MRNRVLQLFVLFILCLANLFAVAQSYETEKFIIQKSHSYFPDFKEADFYPMLYNLEAPVPDGNSARSFLMRQKILSRELFLEGKFSHIKVHSRSMKSVPVPTTGLEFTPSQKVGQNMAPISAGIPSDNTMAVSDGGIILIAMNSFIYAWDIEGDSALFPNYRIGLSTIAGGSPLTTYYDPKVYYDPDTDRFVLAFLRGFTPGTSQVFLCFSQTNNPLDGWHVYSLPGNPLDNNRWTDFPCIALTDKYVYFTANLIIPDVSWQEGFDGSIIWRSDKHQGYAGDDIQATLFYDIKFNDRLIRNLNPVQGADGIADQMVLLSNRNFDIINDTIFFVKVDGDTVLDIHALRSDIPYGVPPNGRQVDTDPSSPEYGLQTNDARVLGAIKFSDQIQFVSNTIDPETGYSAVYHGIITEYDYEPQLTARIIGDTVMDFAYPNLAWSGNEECDRDVIIVFNMTSFVHFPGVAAVYMNNEGNYSPVKIIKEGYNYVHRLSGSYQRWGDYTGIQRKYNDQGRVFAFGFLALADKKNGGHCVELLSPDSTSFRFDFMLTAKGVCENLIEAYVFNGTPPYEYSWNGNEFEATSYMDNVCGGDTVRLEIIDSKSCSAQKTYVIPFTDLPDDAGIYPNPASDLVAVQFHMENEGIIRVELYNAEGKQIAVLLEAHAKKGLNEFIFSAQSLTGGFYSVVISTESSIIATHKLIKTP